MARVAELEQRRRPPTAGQHRKMGQPGCWGPTSACLKGWACAAAWVGVDFTGAAAVKLEEKEAYLGVQELPTGSTRGERNLVHPALPLPPALTYEADTITGRARHCVAVT